MNVKYGIISIGCFIGFWLPIVRLAILSMNTGSCPAGQPLFMIAIAPCVLINALHGNVQVDDINIMAWVHLLIWFSCVFLGIFFGRISFVKKESPKWCSITGLLLNIFLFLLCTYFLFRTYLSLYANLPP